VPILILALIIPIHYSDAISNKDHITVVISDTCKRLLSLNTSTFCPTYEEILVIFSDTSDQTRSGNFTYNENGFFERGPAQMKQHREYYRYTDGTAYQNVKNVYWIDPPADILLSGAKKIIIEADNFIYPTRATEINDTSIEIGANRYVSTTCSYSIITAANWIFLLGDTMRYMASGCDNSGNYTFFNDTTTYYWDAVKHDITTTQKWKFDQLVKETKERCNVRCNEYDTVGQNMTIQEIYAMVDIEITIDPVAVEQYLCKESGPLCDYYLYKLKLQIENVTIPEIINVTSANPANHTLNFNATLSFTDEMFTDHVVVEPDPCEIAGPLCDLYRYQQTNHTKNESAYNAYLNAKWYKESRDMAGEIGE